MKKIFTPIIALLMAAVLCSCGGLGINIADSIVPPKPSGELYNIQKTLETYVGGSVSLVYPESGRYRSAIITKDLDGDGKPEVFSFYKTSTDDKTAVLHINYIRWTDAGGWVSVSDIEVKSSGVESVEFATLDHSGLPKIIVSWSRFSAVDKQVSVYEMNAGILAEVTSESYSVFSTCDFDGDGVSDIVAVHLDKEAGTSTASLLSLTEQGFTKNSSCMLDGNVTSYYEPVISSLADGTPAIFIDAAKSTGMITEVLCISDGTLISIFSSPEVLGGENVRTLRASSVRSSDFDGDGSVDIPLAEKLPSPAGTQESDVTYMTTWNRVDGNMLTPMDHTIINYVDGYYVIIPDEWVGNITMQRNLDIRQRIISRWSPDEKAAGEEIVRLQTLKIKEWESNLEKYENYFELARSSEDVMIAKLSNSALNPGEDYIRAHFRLIDDAAANKTGTGKSNLNVK